MSNVLSSAHLFVALPIVFTLMALVVRLAFCAYIAAKHEAKDAARIIRAAGAGFPMKRRRPSRRSPDELKPGS